MSLIQRLSVAAALTVLACGGAQRAGIATTRDSAGVRIVENSGPAWQAGQGWKVVDSPLVDIGGRVGEPAYELDQVRGPIAMSDGRLVIANGATNDIRLYDSQGKHVRTSGREGSGPGEYRNIVGIWSWQGDSILVAEVLNRRLTVLDREGGMGRIFSLGGQQGALVPTNGKVDLAIPLGWFADGSVVGVSQSFTINQNRPGIFRDSMTMLHYGPDGALRDTLGRFPGTETEQMTLTMNGQSFSAPTAVPLGKQTSSAVGHDRLFVATNEAWQIEMHGTNGELHTLARASVKAVKLTPSDAAAHRREQLDAMEGQPMFRNIPEAIRTQMKSRVEQAKYPATLPFFGSFLVDAVGNLWAQEGGSPAQKVQRFDVVDSTGRWLGVVTMPDDFRPSFITPGAVYGVWRDADKVEHVRGYRLRKP